MSKLADAIRRIQRVEAAPMGFGAARPAPKPSMLVGYIGPAGAVAEAKAAGADLLVVAEAPADTGALRQAAGDLPLGLEIGGEHVGAPAKNSGIDFLLIDAETTPAAALLDEERGYVIALPDGADETYLRSLESLSLEAVYLSKVPSPFTVARQMELARAAALSHKPLACLVDAAISGEDLQCLRAAGVAVVLSESAAAVTTLKGAVAALPPRRQRREERPVVSLPRGAAPQEDEDDDDDDSLDRA